MASLEGKVGLVTGASSGIGAAICKKMVEAGMTVVGVARRVEKIQDLAASLSNLKGKLHAVKCDLGVDSERSAMFDHVISRYGPLHILVNNAAMSNGLSLLDANPEQWRQMLELNIVALCHLSQLAAKHMDEKGVEGHILHISSEGGHHVVPMKELHFYSCTKFALRALTEGLRREVRSLSTKIRVTSISPGAVITEFLALGSAEAEAKDKSLEMLKGMTNLTAEEVADIVVYALAVPGHVEIGDLLVHSRDQLMM